MVGDGRYISLSDPSSVQHLDAEMKSTAKSQLKVMQDQMTMLMAKLGNWVFVFETIAFHRLREGGIFFG